MTNGAYDMARAQAQRRDAAAPDAGAESAANLTSLRSVPAETTPVADAPAPERPRLSRLRKFLLVLGPVALLAGGAGMYLAGGRYVATDNAYVRADKVTVSTDVSGIVA